MNRYIILFFTLLTCSPALLAQQKVAVFDPIGVSGGLKTIIQSKVSKAFTENPNYQVLERSLIDKLMEENKFQSKGLVDENQFTELGRKLGADLVCLTIAVEVGGQLFISCKLIDYGTSQIIRQQTTQIPANASPAITETTIENLAADMIRKKIAATSIASAKIAVFEPIGIKDDKINAVIREEVSGVIVNNSDYQVLERSNIDKVLEENKFQANYSNDGQVRELGKMMGADYVCIITATSDPYYFISCKQVAVETGAVTQQSDYRSYSLSDIGSVAKIAAIKFASNPDELQRDIERIKKENERIAALEEKTQEKARKEKEKAAANAAKQAKSQSNTGKSSYFVGTGSFISYGLIGVGIGSKVYSGSEYKKYHDATVQADMDSHYNKANTFNKVFYAGVGTGVAAFIINAILTNTANSKAQTTRRKSYLGSFFDPNTQATGLSYAINF